MPIKEPEYTQEEWLQKVTKIIGDQQKKFDDQLKQGAYDAPAYEHIEFAEERWREQVRKRVNDGSGRLPTITNSMRQGLKDLKLSMKFRQLEMDADIKRRDFLEWMIKTSDELDKKKST